jgi:VWFA-related protein
MKKAILLLIILSPAFVVSVQEIQHEAVAVNVEVPVRVFKGNYFIDDLSIDDFEVYEDGVLQKIEAVYLIKKTDIAREESGIEDAAARNRFSPQVSRNFVLFFYLTDYLPKVKDAMDHFFGNVIMPGDTMIVVTPVKAYSFNQKSFEVKSRQEIAEQLDGNLRKDITSSSQEYKNAMRDYEAILRFDYPPDLRNMLLRDKIREMKNLRHLNEERINGLADYLKNMEGQKHVFLFYQKALIPNPAVSPESFEYIEFMSTIMSFNLLNMRRIKQTFSDSSISVYFLYITNIQGSRNIERMDFVEMEMFDASADVFNVFNEMAESTGGITDSSANIAASLERASNASDNYYLLYYVPRDYKADGKFRKIDVKVKGKNYRITHRAGYISD